MNLPILPMDTIVFLSYRGDLMKIQSSGIEMYAHSKRKEQATLQLTKLDDEKQTTTLPFKDTFKDLLDLQHPQKTKEVNGASNIGSTKVYEISEEDYQKVLLLEKLLSFLTGKDIKFTLPKKVELTESNGNTLAKNGGNHLGEAPKPYYRKKVSYDMSQSMTFKAAGTVKTSDGRTIDFSIQLQRHESFQFRSETLLSKDGKVVDPLVINYDGPSSKLTQSKYAFDLDFDGTDDQISFLQKGSGFLAIDLNDNGKIDDGRELFGPSSGNGFKDLALHDEDQNGWIDENDSVFSKLRIWNKNEQGQDVLLGLGEVGVGAIYLGHVATDFSLGNSPLSPDGYIRQTGIFLKENGQAGTVHHIDLTL
ncbi:hypothetical protein [Petrocella atlantisensis]|nr:hypothetical protein [Petrocella atlantisensis]